MGKVAVSGVIAEKCHRTVTRTSFIHSTFFNTFNMRNTVANGIDILIRYPSGITDLNFVFSYRETDSKNNKTIAKQITYLYDLRF